MLKWNINANVKGGAGHMESRKGTKDVTETISETNFTHVSH